MSEKKSTKAELAKQIARLEAKIRRLQSTSVDTSESSGGEGVSKGLVTALGKMVPGLNKLIELASQMPEFHDRLASLDEEIKRKFKEQPLRQASVGLKDGGARRQVGIPPSVRRRRAAGGGAARPGKADTPRRRARRGSYHKPDSPKIHISPETPEQLPVDEFDEGDHLLILAEAHGLSLEQITVSLEGTVLVISTDAPERKAEQRLELPCAVTGKPKVSLANGILNIKIDKVDES